MIAALPLTPAGRFAFIIAGLCHTAAKHGHKSRVEASVIAAVWNRLRRIAVLFAALAAQLQAGTLPAPHHRTASPHRRTSRPHDKSAKPRIPTRFGWLLRLAAHEAAAFRSQLIHLLWEPEVIALLEASPRLGRMLRGLCRLLGIKLREGVVPPALILPKRSRQKRRPQNKRRGNICGQADATSNQPASSLLRNSSQPPSREQEFSDASQSADCEIASELLTLHEHILRRAEAYPAIDQAPPDPDPPSFVPIRQRLS